MSARETIRSTLIGLIEPMSAMLVNDSEVVLHELDKLPNSIIAISGNITGRKKGDSAPDHFIERYKAGTLTTQPALHMVLPDGRHLRSSTILIPDPESGEPFLALCINLDVTIWRDIGAVANMVFSELPTPSTLGTPEPTPRYNADRAPQAIDELADLILNEVVHQGEVPVKYMHKDQKVRIVAELKQRGFFGLREAAERAAEELQVSRFTIYNYLKELEDIESAPVREAP